MGYKQLFFVLALLILLAAIVPIKADDTPPQSYITTVAWSPDGSKIAYSQNDGVVKVQNLVGQEMIHEFQGTSSTPINTLTFIDQGNSVIAGATDGVIRKWDINTDELLYTSQPSPFLITGLDLNPVHPNILAVIYYQGQLSLVDTDTGNVTLVLDAGGMGEDFDVDWNADGTQLATASGGTIALWDGSTGKRLSSILDLTGEQVDVDWNSHDINTIVAVTNVGTMKTWDTATGKVIKTFALNTTDGFPAVEFSPDGSKIVTTSYGGKLTIWDSETGDMLTIIENKGFLLTAAWSPDGTKIAYGGEAGELHIVDVSPELSSVPDITAVAWSPDGTRIVEGSTDGFLRVWDTSGEALLDLKGVTGTTRSVDWSPDSTKIVSGGDDKFVRVWDANTGDVLATMEGHEDVIESVDWSPDGTKIASTSFSDANTLRLWNGTNHTPIASFDAGLLFGAQWNPDSSKLVLAGQNGYVIVTDATTLATSSGSLSGGGILSVSWSSDGSKIASGNYTSQIEIWNSTATTKLATFNGHTDRVDAVAFSSNGQRLASTSNDGTLQIWDIATGQAIASFPKSIALTASIAWSPDGTKIAYGDSNSTIKILDVPEAEATPESP
jgi:WD40 repeat protein